MRGQSAESRLFVLPHEAAVAEDIGTEYSGELTFQNPPPGGAIDNRANQVGCQRAVLSNQTWPDLNVNYEGRGFPRFPRAAVALTNEDLRNLDLGCPRTAAHRRAAESVRWFRRRCWPSAASDFSGPWPQAAA